MGAFTLHTHIQSYAHAHTHTSTHNRYKHSLFSLTHTHTVSHCLLGVDCYQLAKQELLQGHDALADWCEKILYEYYDIHIPNLCMWYGVYGGNDYLFIYLFLLNFGCWIHQILIQFTVTVQL